jgi:hypothetical protein
MYPELSGQLEGTYWKNGIYQNTKQSFELQITCLKKPKKTVKKMEWNHNRPLGLILDDEGEQEEEEEDRYISFFVSFNLPSILSFSLPFSLSFFTFI